MFLISSSLLPFCDISILFLIIKILMSLWLIRLLAPIYVFLFDIKILTDDSVSLYVDVGE